MGVNQFTKFERNTSSAITPGTWQYMGQTENDVFKSTNGEFDRSCFKFVIICFATDHIFKTNMDKIANGANVFHKYLYNPL